MGQYRISRNLEASILQYIEAELLTGGWTDITVLKGFSRVYNTSVPLISVRLSDTEHSKSEIGSDATYRIPLIFIDIFGSNDGNRLDLKDFLVDILKTGMPYYEYTITSGVISNKTQNGNIGILEVRDVPINFDIDKNESLVQDRYRHLLTLQVELNRLEA